MNSQFKELSTDELLKVLGLTIKEDNENKLIAFLAMLTAYTESDQMNISFNAPSSTGKSYIPIEVSNLFPREDVLMRAYCSPTSFFHESGTKCKDGSIRIDLSRKIIIFIDQPHQMLLERLRPLLSHDQKELIFKITDKDKGKQSTKTIKIKGYPVVVFCSAGMKIDEQESTRFIMLSPETTQQKLKESITEKIVRMGNPYIAEELYNDPMRQNLMARISAIKAEKIDKVIISNTKRLKDVFVLNKRILLPRHQRDIGKVGSLIKAFALLNLWNRKKKGGVLYANEEDLENALTLWSQVNEGQELGVTPYVYKFYKDIILEGMSKNGEVKGSSRKEIAKIHYKKYGRPLSDFVLRMELLPSLENAGLIEQGQNPNDKRETLIYPTPQTI